LQRVAALGAGFGPAKKETVHVHDLSLSPRCVRHGEIVQARCTVCQVKL